GVSLVGYKVWLGYNSFVGPTLGNGVALQQINCDSVLVGNQILYYGLSSEGGRIAAYNNVITITASAGPTLWLRSTVAEIINNTIVNSLSGDGVDVDGGIVPMTFRGNIIYAPSRYAIYALGQTLTVSYCDLVFRSGYGVTANTPVVNCITDNPSYDGNYLLFSSSPCIGKGPPEAIYYNRGTTNRNDIGWTGGPLYNPSNYTNDNPMVFFLTGSPQI